MLGSKTGLRAITRATRLLSPSALTMTVVCLSISIATRCIAAEPMTSPDIFATRDYPTVLGFDLRNERAPVATVVVNGGLAAENRAINFALPFKTAQSSTNEEALFRVGAFERWTLVTYDDFTTRWPQQVSFFPITDIMPEPTPQNAELQGSLYFRNEGQVWRFLYRYPDVKQPNVLPSSFYRLPTRSFDAIGVAIPSGATRLEVRGNTAIPEHMTENAYARFYPPRPASANEPFLEIRYLLPPTSGQRLIARYAAKIVGAFGPLLIAMYTYYNARENKRRRNTIVIATAIVYLVLGYLLYRFAAQIGETGIELLADYALLAVSAVIGLIALYFKVEEPARAPQSLLPTPAPPKVDVRKRR